MKEKRKSVVLLTVLLLLALLVQPVQAATKIGLSKTNYKVMVGYTYPLYLKWVPLSQMEKVKWTSSKSSVVTVSGTNWVTGTDGISEYDSKYAMALLTPKKKGTAVITARYKEKEFKCHVKVVKPRFINNSNYQVVHVKRNGTAIISYKQGDRLL